MRRGTRGRPGGVGGCGSTGRRGRRPCRCRGRRPVRTGAGWASGRRFVTAAVLAVLVLWGSLYLAFRDWRAGYRERQAFGRGTSRRRSTRWRRSCRPASARGRSAPRVAPGPRRSPPRSPPSRGRRRPPDAWREAVAGTHAMLVTLTAANVMKWSEMNALSVRVASLTARPARRRPSPARRALGRGRGPGRPDRPVAAPPPRPLTRLTHRPRARRRGAGSGDARETTWYGPHAAGRNDGRPRGGGGGGGGARLLQRGRPRRGRPVGLAAYRRDLLRDDDDRPRRHPRRPRPSPGSAGRSARSSGRRRRGAGSQNVWAPELHHRRGKWYVYFAADDGENASHRMYVLGNPPPTRSSANSRSRGGSPAPGPTAGRSTGRSSRTAAGSISSGRGGRGRRDVRQDLYIAPMRDPWTLAGPRVRDRRPDPRLGDPRGPAGGQRGAGGRWSGAGGLRRLLGERELDRPLLPGSAHRTGRRRPARPGVVGEAPRRSSRGATG